MRTLTASEVREHTAGIAADVVAIASTYPDADAGSYDPAPRDEDRADDAGRRSQGGHSDPTGDAVVRAQHRRGQLAQAGADIVAARQRLDSALAILQGLAS